MAERSSQDPTNRWTGRQTHLHACFLTRCAKYMWQPNVAHAKGQQNWETQNMAVPKDPNSWQSGSHTNVLGFHHSLHENGWIVRYNQQKPKFLSVQRFITFKIENSANFLGYPWIFPYTSHYADKAGCMTEKVVKSPFCRYFCQQILKWYCSVRHYTCHNYDGHWRIQKVFWKEMGSTARWKVLFYERNISYSGWRSAAEGRCWRQVLVPWKPLRLFLLLFRPHYCCHNTRSGALHLYGCRLSSQYTDVVCMYVFDATTSQRARSSSFTRFLDHTQRRTTVGKTPLDEWSARRRDLYQTTHNTHNRQDIHAPPVGFEPTISAGERPQTYALDRAATGTGI